ncbi:MAG: ATP-dependent helicase, partial [Cyanobacteria bacterium J06628_3]
MPSQLEILLQVQQGDIAQKEFILNNNIQTFGQHHSLEKFFSALCFYWTDETKAKKYLPSILEPIFNQAVVSEYHWLAMETAELLSRLKPDSSYETTVERLQSNTGIESIVDLIHSQEPWELCLNALVNIYNPPEAIPKAASQKRLAWFIAFRNSK